MFYSVCTSCTFLRAYSSEARVDETPKRCPSCGGRMLQRGKPGRFEPTYVGKVAMALHNTPELRESPAG